MDWNIIIFVLATFLLAIAAILISKIILKFSFRMKNLSECTLDIHLVTAYGLIRIKRTLDIKDKLHNLMNDEGKSQETVGKWQKKLEDTTNDMMLKDLKAPMLEALKNLTIHCFVWRSGAGVGEAAATGRLAGAVWSIKGIFEAWLKRYVPMKKAPELSFVPFFQAVGFDTEISCMVSIRTGKAILTLLRFIKKWKKLNNRRTENNGTSNQGVNDDSDGKFERNDRCEYDRWRSG